MKRKVAINANADVERQVLETLDCFKVSVANRNLEAVLSLFADTPDVMLIGSEAGEVARGKQELRDLLRKLLSLPVSISWEWKNRIVSQSGNIAWVFADGSAVVTGKTGEDRIRYIITGVLERSDDKWLWRQYHGSEPRAPRQGHSESERQTEEA